MKSFKPIKSCSNALRLSLVLGVLSVLLGAQGGGRGKIVVGAKNFTESGVLAELMAQMIEEHTELEVERRLSLGGTMICWAALREGEIDLYADYTGTGWSIVLKEKGKIKDPLRAFFHVRRRYLENYDVRWLEPFGLNNTYALVMDADRAEELGITRISDLVQHQASLKAGFSIEFGNREDGYPGLAGAYGMNLGSVRPLEHALAYKAIESGEIDLTDAYSTDSKLLRYRLRVLEDDRRFFPPYNAAPLVREETLKRYPDLEPVLNRLAFRVSDQSAQALNYVVETHGLSFAVVARAFLELEGLVRVKRESSQDARAAILKVLGERPVPGMAEVTRLSLGQLMVDKSPLTIRLLLEHLGLTLAAVVLAALLAIPLGILCSTSRRLRQVALGLAGVVQTIPSLALLAFVIPILGLSVKAAVAVLFMYSVLPILRNTDAGIRGVDPSLVDAARGMGMRPGQIMLHVQLPLALRMIMAGIRTATVICIGVATLAAFIGAGGLGEPIVEGLYLDDVNLILTGAIPAAMLAVVTDLLLGRVERTLEPRVSS